MITFNYNYKGETRRAAALHIFEDGKHNYLISTNDLVSTITPSRYRTPSGGIIWNQVNTSYPEPDQPHDLAQAIGEGLIPLISSVLAKELWLKHQ
jgi:hypothetical protein